MAVLIKQKLNTIQNVWNSYILKYKACHKKIKFTEDVKTNYVGIIFGNFEDALDIIYQTQKRTTSYPKIFANHISLLQAVYIHQDLIEELLYIFNCNITKGNLKQDVNYSINREIRNELIGHPIRKNEGRLISSSLFGYDSTNSNISYLRYHKDNNHSFEHKTELVSEIINRHTLFLNTYLDKIINKNKTILKAFLKNLNVLENHRDKDFSTLLKILNVSFESIFEFNHLYEKEKLLSIYNLKSKHQRYSNFIERFYKDLNEALVETKEYSLEIINREYKKSKIPKKKIPEILPIFFTEYEEENIKMVEQKNSRNYHYELVKLATRRNYDDFIFFSNPIRNDFSNNEIIIEELDNMQKNLSNDLEYFCSYRLISALIDNDEVL